MLCHWVNRREYQVGKCQVARYIHTENTNMHTSQRERANKQYSNESRVASNCIFWDYIEQKLSRYEFCVMKSAISHSTRLSLQSVLHPETALIIKELHHWYIGFNQWLRKNYIKAWWLVCLNKAKQSSNQWIFWVRNCTVIAISSYSHTLFKKLHTPKNMVNESVSDMSTLSFMLFVEGSFTVMDQVMNMSKCWIRFPSGNFKPDIPKFSLFLFHF